MREVHDYVVCLEEFNKSIYGYLFLFLGWAGRGPDLVPFVS